ncbi:MAG TPA: sugar-binding protein, partial [Gammaproteobacteria bacterium]|nr:sugar-binding protein [Gammaproteobacteria bacterium]
MMRIFRNKVAVLLIALFALVAGPFLGTAVAGGKIALVTDLGGRGDLSFNDMGFKGADEAAAKFDLELVTIQSNSGTDYLP